MALWTESKGSAASKGPWWACSPRSSTYRAGWPWSAARSAWPSGTARWGNQTGYQNKTQSTGWGKGKESENCGNAQVGFHRAWTASNSSSQLKSSSFTWAGYFVGQPSISQWTPYQGLLERIPKQSKINKIWINIHLLQNKIIPISQGERRAAPSLPACNTVSASSILLSPPSSGVIPKHRLF